jgi:hypothetical protein
MEYGMSINFKTGSFSYARGCGFAERFFNERSGLQKGRNNDHRMEEKHARIHKP